MSVPEQRLAEVKEVLISTYQFLDERFRNVFADFTQMTYYRWIRIGLIVLGYICIRPLLSKLSSYLGEKEKKHRDRKENEQKDKERRERKAKAKVGANQLRTGGRVIGEIEDDGEGGETLVVESRDAGRKGARRRNEYKTDKANGVGKNIQKILDEMESDEDVEDLITGISKD